MIDFFSKLLISFSDYLIKGLFISVLVLILVNYIFKNKFEKKLSLQIIKWIIIIYSSGVLLNTVLLLIFPHSEKYNFVERATGAYWWAYWIMFILNAIVPLFLLHNKMGRNIYFVLLIAIIMNTGWLFESFVIHLTGIQSDLLLENYNPYLPNSREILIVINGLLLGAFSLVSEFLITKRRNFIKFLKTN